jgi:hypothetical protein
MVTRPQPPGSVRPAPDGDPLHGLFDSWRRVVTAVMGASGKAASAVAASRPLEALRLALRYVRDPSGTLVSADESARERLKEAGAAALAVGALIAFAISTAAGVSPVRRFLALGWTAAWALARLAVMRLAADRSPGSPRRVESAWGPALLPYLGAVVFPLDIAALALSAALTHRGLVALGASRADARRTVAFAFGGQLVAETVAWAGRAGMLAFVASP